MNTDIRDLLREITTDALRYWERKRIWYNLYLLIPSVLGYVMSIGISTGIGDKVNESIVNILLSFVLSAILANIAYSFAYIPDFFIQLSDYKESWRKHRLALFLLGCIISFPPAFVTAYQIALGNFN